MHADLHTLTFFLLSFYYNFIEDVSCTFVSFVFSILVSSSYLLLCPQAAAKFRQFWGDKAELRRFQDGNIAEAVVWECGPAERHSVVDRLALSHCL
jgi:hypothetical protein